MTLPNMKRALPIRDFKAKIDRMVEMRASVDMLIRSAAAFVNAAENSQSKSGLISTADIGNEYSKHKKLYDAAYARVIMLEYTDRAIILDKEIQETIYHHDNIFLPTYQEELRKMKEDIDGMRFKVAANEIAKASLEKEFAEEDMNDEEIQLMWYKRAKVLVAQ